MRRGARCAVSAVALALVAITGCGRKAPPSPPAIRVAERTQDLHAVQEERTVQLTWSYPQMTSAGGPLPDLEAVAVWRMVIPIAQEPPSTGLRDRKVRVGLLEARGEVITELEGDRLDLNTRGASLVAQDDLDAIQASAADADAEIVVWYAVRSRCCRHRWSDFSNIVRVVPEDPPAPPADLVAATDREGVHLEWSLGDDVAVRVERSSDAALWQTVGQTEIAAAGWTDRSAAQGERWAYRVRSVQEKTEGAAIRIGPPGPSIWVEHPDRYPPEPPADLVCLPEGEKIRLRWRAAPGASTYEIRRTVGGEPAVVVGTVDREVYFLDEAPPAGNLTYMVRGVDEAGNLSEPVRCETVVEEGS